MTNATGINGQHSMPESTLHNHQENPPTNEENVINNSDTLDDFHVGVINEHHAGTGGGGTLAPSAPSVTAISLSADNHQSSQPVHFRKAPSHSELNHKILNGIRPTSIVRTSSYAPSMGGHSHRSTASDMDHLIPPPSTDHEKSKHTRRYFATVFAISWAIFLVILGTVVFVADAALKTELYPIGESIILFMISLSFVYFIFLYVDIRLHVRKAKLTMNERERRQKLFDEQNRVVFGQFGIPISDEAIGQSLRLEPLNAVSHKYCFMTGRHGEFFYLKFGASWFALGLLIHSILQIAYQIIFLTSHEQQFCASQVTLAMDIIFPLYSLFVLFFIFKYMNVIINEYRGLARIMLMHALGTSLSMWIYTIVTETSNAIDIAQSIEDEIEVTHECVRPDVLNYIHRNISPYLYPFIIEYCILIVGIFYMMWANISHCPRKYSALGHHGHENHAHDNGTLEDQRVQTLEDRNGLPNGDNRTADRPQSVMSDEHCDTTTDHEQLFKSNLIISVDCHASNRGLFAGLILIVVTIVFIILFFIATSDGVYLDIGIMVNNIFELVVLIILIIVVVLAYFQTSKLDINHHPMSMLDDMLLFIAVPAFFLDTIFSLVPAIINGSGLRIGVVFAQLIQVLIQTPFIIDGLRRCANAAHLRKEKPGRELITFLTIANVSLWLVYTFSVKTNYTGDERYEFYGYVLWNILNHISLPLIMFYRFHASVCLVDMWRHSYEPEPVGH